MHGVKAVKVSSLISCAERKKVLKHPLLLAHGDAAGIARKTGIITSDKILKALAAEMAVEARTRQLHKARGVHCAEPGPAVAAHGTGRTSDEGTAKGAASAAHGKARATANGLRRRAAAGWCGERRSGGDGR